MMTPTFVTHSVDKLAEAQRILGRPLVHSLIELDEVQAVEVDLVVTHKAQAAYQTLHQVPVMVEDTGLHVDAWNGLPGALVRWFVKGVGTEGICRMMSSFPGREASARTVVAVYDGSLRLYAGEVRGHIAERPAGDRGFGWDAVFIPEGSRRTFAEMDPAEKDRFSMRRMALEQVALDLFPT
jgi:non-canonical purine NTP pyrophosphatase (RdgB/HAM1 family)